jgi:tRNA(Ile)-lysidine synthase TilS/MesJ
MIRPFVLTPEKDIAYYARNVSLPVQTSLCPEDKHTDREKYKQLLATLERENKGLRHRIFVAIKKADLDGYGASDGMKHTEEEEI